MKDTDSPDQKKDIVEKSDLDKVLKHCLNFVKEDLREKIPNPKKRRARIDDYISTREI